MGGCASIPEGLRYQATEAPPAPVTDVTPEATATTTEVAAEEPKFEDKEVEPLMDLSETKSEEDSESTEKAAPKLEVEDKVEDKMTVAPAAEPETEAEQKPSS